MSGIRLAVNNPEEEFVYRKKIWLKSAHAVSAFAIPSLESVAMTNSIMINSQALLSCIDVHVYQWKKRSQETQTLRAGCSKAEPKIFAPPQTPFPGSRDGQYLSSWRWSYLYLQTQFGEDRCTQFRVIVVTDPHTHTNTQTNKQTEPITIYCAAASRSVTRVTDKSCQIPWLNKTGQSIRNNNDNYYYYNFYSR